MWVKIADAVIGVGAAVCAVSLLILIIQFFI